MYRIHGLPAIAAHKRGGVVSVGAIFRASIKVGQCWANRPAEPGAKLRVLPAER